MTEPEINLAEARIDLDEAEDHLRRAVECNQAYPGSIADQDIADLQRARDKAALEVERCEGRVKGK